MERKAAGLKNVKYIESKLLQFPTSMEPSRQVSSSSKWQQSFIAMITPQERVSQTGHKKYRRNKTWLLLRYLDDLYNKIARPNCQNLAASSWKGEVWWIYSISDRKKLCIWKSDDAKWRCAIRQHDEYEPYLKGGKAPSPFVRRGKWRMVGKEIKKPENRFIFVRVAENLYFSLRRFLLKEGSVLKK